MTSVHTVPGSRGQRCFQLTATFQLQRQLSLVLLFCGRISLRQRGTRRCCSGMQGTLCWQAAEQRSAVRQLVRPRPPAVVQGWRRAGVLPRISPQLPLPHPLQVRLRSCRRSSARHPAASDLATHGRTTQPHWHRVCGSRLSSQCV